MGNHSRTRKNSKYLFPVFLATLLASCMTLAFGLRSYASQGFNPQVQIGVLDTKTGMLEPNPTFKSGGVYTLQLSAILPTEEEVNNAGGTGYAIQAMASSGVQIENLSIINTWTGVDPYPTFAGLNTYTGQGGNPDINFLQQIGLHDLEGISFSSSQAGSSPKIWTNAWTLTLTSEFVSFLESNGYQAATTTAKEQKGLKAGERFGITFQAKIVTNSGSKRNVTAYAGYPDNSSEAPTQWHQMSTKVLDMDTHAPVTLSHLGVTLQAKKNGEWQSGTIEETVGSHIDFRAMATLPNPSDMTGNQAYFAFKIKPSLGVTLTNLNNVTVGGIPLASLPSGYKKETSGTGNSVAGGKFAYWTLELTQADIQEIEKSGTAPTGSEASGMTSKGISAGSTFALAFSGMLDSNAPSSTGLSAQVGHVTASGWWSLVSPKNATLTITPTGNSTDLTENLSLNLLNKQGLVDTSTPHYYMTSLEAPYDPEQIISSHVGAHKFQISLPLPNPSSMTGNKSVLVIKNIPGLGLSVVNPNFIQQTGNLTYIGDITVAGLPLTLFREVFSIYNDRPFVVSPNSTKNGMITGTSDGSHYWELVLTKSEIQEIEQKGTSAATSSSPQGKAPGLKPGDMFAITFNGFVTKTESSQVTNGEVTDTAEVGWANQTVTAASSSTSAGSQGSSSPTESESLSGYSKVSSQSITLHPKELEIQPAASLWVVSQGYQNPYPYVGIGDQVEFQLEAALPDPAQMNGQWAQFDLVDTPCQGVSVENPKEAPSDFELAGLPLLSIPGVQVSSASSGQWIDGGGQNSPAGFTVQLDAQSVEYIEKNGLAPATMTALQGTEPGKISKGSLFALTFPGKLTEAAATMKTTPRNTAYSQYVGTLNGQQVTDKSPLASRGLKYNGIATPLTAELGVINQNTGKLEQNPVYKPGEQIEFQFTVTLPDPSALNNSQAAANSYYIPGWYAVQIAPGPGLTVNTYYSTNVSVAGIPWQYNFIPDVNGQVGVTYKDNGQGLKAGMFPNNLDGVSGNNTPIPSKDLSYWGISFNSSDIKYIEQNGELPATYASAAHKPSGGLKPGDKFAVTFMGQLDENAASSVPLYAFVGYHSNYPGNPSQDSNWWTLGGYTGSIAWENSRRISTSVQSAGKDSGSDKSGSSITVTRNQMWPYALSSYRSATIWVSKTDMSSPTNTIEVVNGGKKVDSPAYPQNSPIDFRVVTSLPNASEMVGNYGYYRVQISPKSGISVYNGALAANLANIKINGAPVSSIPGAYFLSSSSASTIQGGRNMTLILPASAVKAIENGNYVSGSTFNLDFTGFLNQNASMTGSNTIASTSSYSATPSGAASLASEESQVSVKETAQKKQNEKDPEILPLTGGKGIIAALSIAAMLIMAAAAAAQVFRKRRR